MGEDFGEVFAQLSLLLEKDQYCVFFQENLVTGTWSCPIDTLLNLRGGYYKRSGKISLEEIPLGKLWLL